MRRILAGVALAAILGVTPALAQGTPVKPDTTKKAPTHMPAKAPAHRKSTSKAPASKTPATPDSTKKHPTTKPKGK